MPMIKDTMLKRLLLPKLAAGGSGSAPVEATATGNPLTFLTDLARTLKSLLIPFTPQQEGSGDPAPDNVRNIMPWNGLTVKNGGKNLLDTSVKQTYSPTTVGIGSIYGRYETKLKAGKYTLSVEFLNGEHYGAYIKQKDGNQIDLWTASNVSVNTKTFTLTQDGDYNVWLYRSQNAGGVDADNIGGFQLEVGETATAYEPYSPITSHPVAFASTVYGGTLDMISGVLTVEWAGEHLTSASNWTEPTAVTGGSGMRTFVVISDAQKEGYSDVMCDKLKTSKTSSPNEYCCALDINRAFLVGLPTSIDTSQKLKDWLDEIGGFNIAYPIATPQEIQLTPEQITALVGNNTLWSDADGSMTAIYYKKQ